MRGKPCSTPACGVRTNSQQTHNSSHSYRYTDGVTSAWVFSALKVPGLRGISQWIFNKQINCRFSNLMVQPSALVEPRKPTFGDTVLGHIP